LLAWWYVEIDIFVNFNEFFAQKKCSGTISTRVASRQRIVYLVGTLSNTFFDFPTWTCTIFVFYKSSKCNIYYFNNIYIMFVNHNNPPASLGIVLSMIYYCLQIQNHYVISAGHSSVRAYLFIYLNIRTKDLLHNDMWHKFEYTVNQNDMI